MSAKIYNYTGSKFLDKSGCNVFFEPLTAKRGFFMSQLRSLVINNDSWRHVHVEISTKTYVFLGLWLKSEYSGLRKWGQFRF